MWILLIALIPAVAVIVTRMVTDSKLWTTMAALVAAAIGIFTGNPIYALLDLAVVAVAYWMAMGSLLEDDRTERQVKVRLAEASAEGQSSNTHQPTKSLHSGNNTFGALVLVGIVGYLVYLLFFASKPNTAGANQSEPPVPREQIKLHTPTGDDAKLLAKTQRRVNQRYPALDPNAFNYSYYALTDVLARQQTLVNQGTQPALAYETAADQIMAARQPRTYVAPQTLTESPQQPVQVQPCEYKAVMADSDYRACGLNPPQSRPLEPRPAPAAVEPEVYDKGNHPGFPPNCRWLSQSEFSCK